MYENLIEIIKTEGPLTNKYLNEKNLNYYSIINEKNTNKKIKGGSVDNTQNKCDLKKYIIIILFVFIIFYIINYKKYTT